MPPARAAGALVSLVNGEPVVYLERGRKSLLTLPAAGDRELLVPALSALVEKAPDGGRGWSIEKIDGGPPAESPLAAALRALGFADGYRGLVLRARSRRA